MKCKNCIHYRVCDYGSIDNPEEEVTCIAYEEPRPHGEWEFVQRGKFVDMVCPFCKNVCVDGIAYNYSIDEVKEIIESDTFSIHGKQNLPNFCSNCGADMRPKEGEEE